MDIYNSVLNKMIIEKNEKPKKKTEYQIFESKKIDIKNKPKPIKKKKYAKLSKRKNL